jgi:hypothetical protein
MPFSQTSFLYKCRRSPFFGFAVFALSDVPLSIGLSSFADTRTRLTQRGHGLCFILPDNFRVIHTLALERNAAALLWCSIEFYTKNTSSDLLAGQYQKGHNVCPLWELPNPNSTIPSLPDWQCIVHGMEIDGLGWSSKVSPTGQRKEAARIQKYRLLTTTACNPFSLYHIHIFSAAVGRIDEVDLSQEHYR